MNKLVLLFLTVGLCQTIEAYCVNRCEPAVYMPVATCQPTCAPCATPCATPCACSTPCVYPTPCGYSTPCAPLCMPCPLPACSAPDCIDTCSLCVNSCDSDDPECQCLKAIFNFPDVDYPSCAMGIQRCYC